MRRIDFVKLWKSFLNWRFKGWFSVSFPTVEELTKQIFHYGSFWSQNRALPILEQMILVFWCSLIQDGPAMMFVPLPKAFGTSCSRVAVLYDGTIDTLLTHFFDFILGEVSLKKGCFSFLRWGGGNGSVRAAGKRMDVHSSICTSDWQAHLPLAQMERAPTFPAAYVRRCPCAYSPTTSTARFWGPGSGPRPGV